MLHKCMELLMRYPILDEETLDSFDQHGASFGYTYSIPRSIVDSRWSNSILSTGHVGHSLRQNLYDMHDILRYLVMHRQKNEKVSTGEKFKAFHMTGITRVFFT